MSDGICFYGPHPERMVQRGPDEDPQPGDLLLFSIGGRWAYFLVAEEATVDDELRVGRVAVIPDPQNAGGNWHGLGTYGGQEEAQQP